MSDLDLDTLIAQYVMPTYGRLKLNIARGEGCRVWDFDGKEYLDFGAGIAVCSLGHAHPEVTDAVAAQAATLVHTSNLYGTRPQAKLAKKLVEVVGDPGGKVFFSNSGAESNEGLIKLARKFGSATGRYEVLTFEGSFHGRTMACLTATGQAKVKTNFEPLLEGFRHVPYGDLEAVRAAIGPKTAAILVEPVQGEGGIHLAAAEFLRGLREICEEHDMLLLFDEIQCGLGRTGDWCGWKSITDIMPDGVSWAKGIANGFPLGAFWATAREAGDRGPICNLLGPGTHATTYGGNPVCCAAALKVMEIIERDSLLENVAVQGKRLKEALEALNSPRIKELRGLGLMIGIDLAIGPEDPKARDLVVQLIDQGMLVIPAGETVLRLLPPLNLTSEDIDVAVEKLGAFLA